MSTPTPSAAASTPSVPPISHPLAAHIQHAYASDPAFKNPTFTSSLSYHHGFWYKNHLIVIPKVPTLIQACIHDMHDPPGRGHLGVAKTLQMLQRFFWWPNMQKDVTSYISTCASCQRNKSSTTKPHGLLQPLPIPPHLGILSQWISSLLFHCLQGLMQSVSLLTS